MINYQTTTERPLISFCLFSFNQEKYIKEAVFGALTQTYSPLEIIISDDCSTDNSFKIIKETIETYKGPHKVVLNRNQNNLGLIKHVNYILSNFVNGEYIALAGGDDISLPDRVLLSSKYLMESDDIKAVTVNYITINDKSETIKKEYSDMNSYYKIDNNYLKQIDFFIGGAGLIIKKEVFDYFGHFKNDCPTEDSTLRLRALLLGSVFYDNAPLLLYRRHSTNLTSNIYNLSTIQIARQYFVDIKLAYSKRIISRSKYIRLKKKVYLYVINRRVLEKHDTINNFFLRFVFKLLLKFIRMIALVNVISFSTE